LSWIYILTLALFGLLNAQEAVRVDSTDTLEVSAPPPPPVDFVFQPVPSEGRLVLRWDGYSARAEAFRVYISKKRLDGTKGLKPSLNLKGEERVASLKLKSGEVYWVGVTALGKGGESAPLPRKVAFVQLSPDPPYVYAGEENAVFLRGTGLRWDDRVQVLPPDGVLVDREKQASSRRGLAVFLRVSADAPKGLRTLEVWDASRRAYKGWARIAVSARAQPVISDVRPDTFSLASEVPISLTVLGKNFSPGAELLVGDKRFPTDFLGPGRLSVRNFVPPVTSPGYISIVVENIDGSRSEPWTGFRVLGPAPILLKFSPDTLTVGLAQRVVVQGKNLNSVRLWTLDGGAFFEVEEIYRSDERMEALVTPKAHTVAEGRHILRLVDCLGQRSNPLPIYLRLSSTYIEPDSLFQGETCEDAKLGVEGVQPGEKYSLSFALPGGEGEVLGLSAEIVGPGAGPGELVVEISVGPDVPPKFYHLRISDSSGSIVGLAGFTVKARPKVLSVLDDGRLPVTGRDVVRIRGVGLEGVKFLTEPPCEGIRVNRSASMDSLLVLEVKDLKVYEAGADTLWIVLTKEGKVFPETRRGWKLYRAVRPYPLAKFAYIDGGDAFPPQPVTDGWRWVMKDVEDARKVRLVFHQERIPEEYGDQDIFVEVWRHPGGGAGPVRVLYLPSKLVRAGGDVALYVPFTFKVENWDTLRIKVGHNELPEYSYGGDWTRGMERAEMEIIVQDRSQWSWTFQMPVYTYRPGVAFFAPSTIYSTVGTGIKWEWLNEEDHQEDFGISLVGLMSHAPSQEKCGVVRTFGWGVVMSLRLPAKGLRNLAGKAVSTQVGVGWDLWVEEGAKKGWFLMLGIASGMRVLPFSW